MKVRAEDDLPHAPERKPYAPWTASTWTLGGPGAGIAGESGCGSPRWRFREGAFISAAAFCRDRSDRGRGHHETAYDTLRTKYLGTHLAYIPQAAMNAMNPTMKIRRFVVDILKEHRPEFSKEQMINLARNKFQALNLPERVLNAYPSELSGGMKQRTVIALSTLLNPRVLIADEPSSALDVSSQKAVISMLRRMMKDGFVKSMIFIPTSSRLRHVADDIVVMSRASWRKKGSAEQVIFDPVHPYLQALMGSLRRAWRRA